MNYKKIIFTNRTLTENVKKKKNLESIDLLKIKTWKTKNVFTYSSSLEEEIFRFLAGDMVFWDKDRLRFRCEDSSSEVFGDEVFFLKTKSEKYNKKKLNIFFLLWLDRIII